MVRWNPFFGKLKAERYHLRRKAEGYETYNQLVNDLIAYIHFYNHERPQDVLSGLTPNELRSVAAKKNEIRIYSDLRKTILFHCKLY